MYTTPEKRIKYLYILRSKQEPRNNVEEDAKARICLSTKNGEKIPDKRSNSEFLLKKCNNENN